MIRSRRTQQDVDAHVQQHEVNPTNHRLSKEVDLYFEAKDILEATRKFLPWACLDLANI